MRTEDPNAYRVMVLLDSGYEVLFSSPEAALTFAQTEMETLQLVHEDLASEPFEGIFCERRDTHELWRYESVEGIPIWVSETEPESEVYDVMDGFDLSIDVKPPRFYC